MRIAGILCSIAIALIASLLAFGPAAIEEAVQGVAPGQLAPVSRAVARQHSELSIVDWHADSLLWARDLLERSDRGHVDLPRLEQGNVAVQMFTVVTKSPLAQNYQQNSADWNLNTLQVVLQRWPLSTWRSLLERALYQAAKLQRFSDASRGRLVVIRSGDDLRQLLKRRAAGDAVVGGLLGIEGAHALEGELGNIDRLFDAGFRMVGLQHFFDNELGGSLHGMRKGGLSEFGRAVLRRLEEREMIVDLAHSSPAVVEDVLSVATRPMVVSHTGLYGICPTPRNISDELMQRIAATGGLIAVGYWDGAVCDTTPEGVVKAIRYAIDLLGADHVALGSDYDGGTTTTFDTSQLAVLTQAMNDARFSEEEIRQVMGESSTRFLLTYLPNAGRIADPASAKKPEAAPGRNAQ